MHFRIQIVSVSDDGTERLQEIVDVSRSQPTLETLGLTLDESKQILQCLQRTIIDHQVGTYLDQQRACPDCGKHRQLKQSDTAPFRTLFGLVAVPNPRWKQCNCQPHTAKAGGAPRAWPGGLRPRPVARSSARSRVRLFQQSPAGWCLLLDRFGRLERPRLHQHPDHVFQLVIGDRQFHRIGV